MSSGKTTPVNMTGSSDSSKPCDPFKPFSGEVIDPFQSKKGLGDPFSGKDPFVSSSASSKPTKGSTLGFTDFNSVSWDEWYCLTVSVHNRCHSSVQRATLPQLQGFILLQWKDPDEDWWVPKVLLKHKT